ncbi:hypothetical protein FLAG1_10760 [Fusarium langsethiae]|uniref:Uncharacterized protein n=1 Tax=Fusarium langsethiae TaxID=179993 RepID=A0A0N0DBC7_FUSLA|nr:hypothetical protein FLAG1_10760 [Fusarium langsethiae]GKU08765.1 unnamed protein product [Fusarium langsethiae]GKU14026.1 unnamed protein product [Fusarium langsethiae]
MGNTTCKKRNADGETIGGVHTANDRRETQSMVLIPGENDVSQPRLKIRKSHHLVGNNGSMNATLQDSVISTKALECSERLSGDTGLDNTAKDRITVQVSTCTAAEAPPTELSMMKSDKDTRGDSSVDSQARCMVGNPTEALITSGFDHVRNKDRLSSRWTGDDVEKASESRDSPETPAHSIPSPGLLYDQKDGPTPSPPHCKAPSNTQEYVDKWDRFFENVSKDEETNDKRSKEEQVHTVPLSSLNNTPVEENGKGRWDGAAE